MRPLLLMAVAAGLASAVAASAHADPVQVSATSRDDSARLNMIWPKPIAFEANSVDGRFVLTFKRPADADFAAVARQLDGFVDAPTRADGGRTLSFPLNSGVVALTLADGKRVVVDLFRQPTETEAELVEETVARAPHRVAIPAGMEAMRPVPAPNRIARRGPTRLQPEPKARADVSPARHGGSGNRDGSDAAANLTTATLRFGWTEPVAAAVFQRGDALWITFDRPWTPDLDALREAAGDAIGTLEQRPHPDATVLRMELAEGLYQPVDEVGWF